MSFSEGSLSKINLPNEFHEEEADGHNDLKRRCGVEISFVMRTNAAEAHQCGDDAGWNSVLEEIHIRQVELSKFVFLCRTKNTASKSSGRWMKPA